MTSHAEPLSTAAQSPAASPSELPGPDQTVSKPRHHRETWRWFPYLIVLPAVLLELAIHIFPMLTGIWMSFVRLVKSYIRNWTAAPVVGLENYRIAIDVSTATGKAFLQSFLITCAFTVLVVSISWGLGMLAAVVLQKPFRGRGLWRTLFLVPYALPMYAGVIAWNFMFQRDTGAINHLLVDQLHLFADRPFWLLGSRAFFSVVLVAIWRMWPFAFLMLMAGLQSIPSDVYEASAIDGASPLRQWRQITLPMLSSVNVVLLLVMFLWVFNDFNTPYVLFGNGTPPGGDLISFHIYNASFLTWDFGIGSAMSVLLLLFLLAVSVVYLVVTNRRRSDYA